ncbi:MAG: hypothetical protein JXJ17_04645 [Anaerolineae bacterium]|nr:hypothetical protein [Anaerolineae bacterium]
MKQRSLLLIDSSINLALGILLIFFTPPVAHWMGLPVPDRLFYVNILGAVFVGIAIALAWEALRDKTSPQVGLGTAGAAAINLCGGAMLAGWLTFGRLTLSTGGAVSLWLLVVFLISISTLELVQLGRSS